MNQRLLDYVDSFAPPREGRRHYTSVQTALAVINETLGTHYRLNRLYEWLNETRPLPAKISNFLEDYEKARTQKNPKTTK